MKVGSLFAGIGGFDLGFISAGADVVWAVEVDAACRAKLAERFPDTTLYEDVREVGAHNLVDVDLVCGGFPCQDISVAGRRAGLAGKRSGLWWEFHRVLAELTPRWCVIENTPGLLSSKNGRDMGAILGALGDLGYGWAYRVLDAQFFGLAQRRKRVFIVGCLGDRGSAAQVLLEPEGVRWNPPSRGEAEPETPGLPVSGTLGGRRGFTGDDIDRGGALVATIQRRGRADGSVEEIDESGIHPALRAGDGGSSRGNIVAYRASDARGQARGGQRAADE